MKTKSTFKKTLLTSIENFTFYPNVQKFRIHLKGMYMLIQSVSMDIFNMISDHLCHVMS